MHVSLDTNPSHMPTPRTVAGGDGHALQSKGARNFEAALHELVSDHPSNPGEVSELELKNTGSNEQSDDSLAAATLQDETAEESLDLVTELLSKPKANESEKGDAQALISTFEGNAGSENQHAHTALSEQNFPTTAKNVAPNGLSQAHADLPIWQSDTELREDMRTSSKEEAGLAPEKGTQDTPQRDQLPISNSTEEQFQDIAFPSQTKKASANNSALLGAFASDVLSDSSNLKSFGPPHSQSNQGPWSNLTSPEILRSASIGIGQNTKDLELPKSEAAIAKSLEEIQSALDLSPASKPEQLSAQIDATGATRTIHLSNTPNALELPKTGTTGLVIAQVTAALGPEKEHNYAPKSQSHDMTKQIPAPQIVESAVSERTTPNTSGSLATNATALAMPNVQVPPTSVVPLPTQADLDNAAKYDLEDGFGNFDRTSITYNNDTSRTPASTTVTPIAAAPNQSTTPFVSPISAQQTGSTESISQDQFDPKTAPLLSQVPASIQNQHLASPLSQTTLPTTSLNNLAQFLETQISIRDNAGKIDVALRPEDLGRLSIKLETTANGTHVVFAADRQETQDLMRRQSDFLQQQFENLGHANLTFSFSSSEERTQASSDEHVGNDSQLNDEVDILVSLTHPTLSGLDIRI